MNMLRHTHIVHNVELVSGTHFVEYLYETVAGSSRSEIREAAITTESYEVEITPSVIASQRVAHRGKNPHP